MVKNPLTGSSFEDFLKEEEGLADIEAAKAVEHKETTPIRIAAKEKGESSYSIRHAFEGKVESRTQLISKFKKDNG